MRAVHFYEDNWMKPGIIFIICFACFFIACEGSNNDNGNHNSSTQSAQVLYQKDPTIACQATLLAETQPFRYQRNVKSMIDNNQLHLAYFLPAGNGNYNIHYLNFDWASLPQKNAGYNSSVIQVDHSRDMQIGYTTDTIPIIMYQGGSYPTCGETEQSDIMLSLFQNNQWREHTISIGTVERNPVINNGLAGYSTDMIIDSTNTIHMCFQFLYEGCDSMNYNYPDLWYIQFSTDNLNELPEHEIVEGNDYENSNKQNNAGEHCSISLDNSNRPFIFYYYVDSLPNKEKGLRVAYRNYQDSWEAQWIVKDIHVDYISAKWNDNQEIMAVAYYVTQNSYGNRNNVLMYAEQTYTGWQSIVVDKSCYCGKYCSLTFDNNGEPIIAYRADQTRSGIALNQLKIAYRKSNQWKKYFCSTVNNIDNLGIDNTIHVDDDAIHITSFSYETYGIYLITIQTEDIE
jgi:hypothetical protein